MSTPRDEDLVVVIPPAPEYLNQVETPMKHTSPKKTYLVQRSPSGADRPSAAQSPTKKQVRAIEFPAATVAVSSLTLSPSLPLSLSFPTPSLHFS